MAVTRVFSGERLRQRRLRRGFSQSELARHAALREQQIVRWERGKNVPNAAALGVLAAALDVAIDDFFEPADGSADDEDEEDDAALRRVASELVRLGHDDLAADLIALARRVEEPVR